MSIQYVKGVGPVRAAIFAQLGIETVGDLLEYFPRDWVFVPEQIKIDQLVANETVTFAGIIESVDFHVHRKPPIFEAYVADETGQCRLIWFHGAFLRNQLHPGQVIMVSGKVGLYKHQLQLTNPKFIILSSADQQENPQFGGAVYPACANLSSERIKKIIASILKPLIEQVNEFYDRAFHRKANLIDRKKAFDWIHNPQDEKQLAKAKRRLKFDELFLMQLALALRRYRIQHYSTASALKCTEKIDSRIRKRFPFLLTEDQNEVISEITADMARSVPMNRLLQGDVGSGKTVVALYAALLAVANKKQVAIMAPTEILATQHFQSIERYLKDSDVKTILITGGLTGKKRSETLEQIRTGQIDIVLGTVALIQADVVFKNMALAVIDEQHKFGVHQRAQLRKKTSPHCLVMTATPIPRTLAMTAFGDLDVSTIKHCPPGRGKVVTRWVAPQNRAKAYDFIKERLRAKKQAYFVYPRISNVEENSEVKAAIEEHELLASDIFAEFKVGLLHGQMTSQQKTETMEAFRKRKIDLLVSTVIIEIGVDVPNATIMVIEGADRFGLAQLHQLRGRIGRGQSNSYCLLFAETQSEIAKNRLDIMTRSNDGFEIAEKDLAIRGPGELLSARQHGLPDLKIANIIEDMDLLILARRNAFELVEADPMLTDAEHANIRKTLINKFGDTLGLADIA